MNGLLNDPMQFQEFLEQNTDLEGMLTPSAQAALIGFVLREDVGNDPKEYLRKKGVVVEIRGDFYEEVKAKEILISDSHPSDEEKRYIREEVGVVPLIQQMFQLRYKFLAKAFSKLCQIIHENCDGDTGGTLQIGGVSQT